MRVTFIRHGQSTGNAGIPCNDLSLLELTEKGWEQAREVAAKWTESPDLIVTSPYLRTQQTARPTIKRFPSVPVVIWPIQEFTYLEPSRWNGTRSVERKPSIEAYWRAADPEFCDGPGAESFGTLLRRAEAALHRLAELPEHHRVFVFSHGQFIQAMRTIVLDPAATDRKHMERFWRADGMPAIGNAELIDLVKGTVESPFLLMKASNRR
jgi:broad specificity phosphatase PhoE